MALATHLGPTVGVTLVATLLAVAAGVQAGRVGLVGLAVLAGQASIGWSNDWLDADRDRAVERADKPVVQGALTPHLLRSAALLAALAAVVLSLLLGLVPGLLLLGVVVCGWAYNCGLKSGVASMLPYLVAFGLLPAGVVAAAPGTPAAPWWLVAAGACLGGAAHLANVAPDLEDDLATGVRGLPHRLGATVSAVAGATLLFAATLLLVAGPAGAPGATGWVALVVAVPAVVVAALAGSARFRRLAFPAVILLTVTDVVLLLAGGASLT
ncbi:ubiquinone biosynthesis protein UbiA [Modestobacter sp. I12A-02628]|uniref:UbiA family prenyltransferase n=1 Tax=Goekera deserti TaxID=2497753 RepID=A0A7K3WKX7_9ACTN|nr:UbiA family prenyltransferase [Goekera deserti]MPQ98188.1 ubiquinone biosynthesis protein UbiA [Goekera deserti]NDI48838.1 ubiquinone biosynthesis protein UbiA [Goekera deserti]NEL56519.1 UbiA family prenyltransferase [Goekera deserti]